MTAPNQVATRQPEKKTIISELERVKPYITEMLPAHVTPERFARLALTTLRKTPKLMNTNPDSFVGALYTAAALGLEPDVNGEAYLVPYKSETQLIIGYQGFAKLFWNHPLAARLSAEYVCENDEFDYDKGLNPRLHHKPALGDRGKVVAYYAIVGLTTGATWFDVYSPETIKKLRGGKVGPSGNIADPEHWMERKTALRQVIKLAPKSAQIQTVDDVDERVIRNVEEAHQIIAPSLDAPEHPTEPVPANVDAATGEVLDAEVVPADGYDDQAWLAGGESA